MIVGCHQNQSHLRVVQGLGIALAAYCSSLGHSGTALAVSSRVEAADHCSAGAGDTGCQRELRHLKMIGSE